LNNIGPVETKRMMLPMTTASGKSNGNAMQMAARSSARFQPGNPVFSLFFISPDFFTRRWHGSALVRLTAFPNEFFNSAAGGEPHLMAKPQNHARNLS
jgi:hypothetical protein